MAHVDYALAALTEGIAYLLQLGGRLPLLKADSTWSTGVRRLKAICRASAHKGTSPSLYMFSACLQMDHPPRAD